MTEIFTKATQEEILERNTTIKEIQTESSFYKLKTKYFIYVSLKYKK